MATEPINKWLYNVAIAADQFFNALLRGAADETLSSRTYRAAVLNPTPKKRWKIIHRTIETLFFWEKGKHCKMAYHSELTRKQYPDAFRKKTTP